MGDSSSGPGRSPSKVEVPYPLLTLTKPLPSGETLYTYEEALRTAREISGTWIQKPSKEDNFPGYGRHIARVGTHITNNVRRYVVHVTCKDRAFRPYTVS
jgi:hypothetical protein